MLDPQRQPLILASASPRRQELLREAGIAFDVHPAHVPEQRASDEPPREYAERLAREKAQAIARRFPGRYVLGADTIVLVGEEVLEKPRDAADAARMLRLLSGREHSVVTAVSLVSPQARIETCRAETKIHFREIREEEIQGYIAGGEPMDKAGAYAIQGGAGKWADRIEGDYSNVVGLPVSLVTKMLKAAGFR